MGLLPFISPPFAFDHTHTHTFGTHHRYVWPPAYNGAQALFEQAQGSYDPNAVAAVLHQVRAVCCDLPAACCRQWQLQCCTSCVQSAVSGGLLATSTQWHMQLLPSRSAATDSVTLHSDEAALTSIYLANRAHAHTLLHTHALHTHITRAYTHAPRSAPTTLTRCWLWPTCTAPWGRGSTARRASTGEGAATPAQPRTFDC